MGVEVRVTDGENEVGSLDIKLDLEEKVWPVFLLL